MKAMHCFFKKTNTSDFIIGSTLNNHKSQNAQRSFLTTLGAVLIMLICAFTTQNPAHAGINDGLIAHYLFDGGMQNIGNDASGNGHVATPMGTVSSAEGVVGANDTAMQSCTDYSCLMTIPNHPDFVIPTCGKMSVAVWVNLTTTSMNVFQMYKNSTEGGYSFSIYSRKPHLDIFKANYSGDDRLWGPVLPLNEWVHVTYVVDRDDPLASSKIYVNGTLASSNNSTYANRFRSMDCTADPFIGRHADARLDNMRIYNRAITEAEINEIYNLQAEYYIDFIDSVGGIYDTDNSGSDEVALLKQTYQGTVVHLKDVENTSLSTDRVITGFFASNTDWVPISVSLSVDSSDNQMLSVIAKSESLDIIRMRSYIIPPPNTTLNPSTDFTTTDMPLYDYTN